MLSFNHPRPVGSGKPVAVLVQEQAAQALETIMTPGSPDKVSAPPKLERGNSVLPLDALHFFVRYTLREYTSFMWQHGGFLIRRRRVRWPASLFLRLKSTFSAALNFVLLGRGRRTYEFTIDEHGIVRTSGGVTLIDWDDVSAVRTYSRGFMMILKRGTLPIPFRCLSEGQLATMRDLVAARHELNVR
ncbi:YcxB family protein [Massilia sp.]|uniref:YcxB family protein n=1 Tax=Massilia sp. TaxID=1882437 RepID=UPI0028984556|nr:YcxB family protein [Massilia sp.]